MKNLLWKEENRRVRRRQNQVTLQMHFQKCHMQETTLSVWNVTNCICLKKFSLNTSRINRIVPRTQGRKLWNALFVVDCHVIDTACKDTSILIQDLSTAKSAVNCFQNRVGWLVIISDVQVLIVLDSMVFAVNLTERQLQPFTLRQVRNLSAATFAVNPSQTNLSCFVILTFVIQGQNGSAVGIVVVCSTRGQL